LSPLAISPSKNGRCKRELPLITAVGKSDLPAIVGLDGETSFAWSRQQWHDELEQPNGWQWAARNQQTNELLGYICGRNVLDQAEIFKLAVATGHRRRGIGALLLGHACWELKKSAIVECYLEVHVSNRVAGALYARMGFSQVATRKDYYGSGEDGLLLTRSI
jgi:[ribosomal protein S18]-alanine N-acetyltransferase